MDFSERLKIYREMTEQALHRLLPAESEPSAVLHQAIRYSMFAGGKRVRPAMCLAACEACGGTPEQALTFACAVEYVHAGSLIHDDLPCMDDDDLRRGKPTCHKVYGEAVGTLAGDALWVMAFELVARDHGLSDRTARRLMRRLAESAGSRNLVGGQVDDLLAEGRPVSAEHLRFIHERKTAALITCAVEGGGICAGADGERIERLGTYGRCLGLAFQIADDMLNETGTPEQLGKAARSDAARGKATYPALVGLEASARRGQELVREALTALDGFEAEAAAFLRDLGRFVVDRRS